ncbi:MAG TPA: branched-chain amino acid ABC transporter permease [Anaerovoracaceae bacterium]|nr:branched-chain amino acid ABC transporter permease [Anaerovoracaceae bacterium]
MNDTSLKIMEPGKKRITAPAVILAAAFIALALLPLGVRPYTVNTMILILMYAYFSSAWNIVCGFLGELSMGHSVMVAMGAYTSTMLLMDFGLNPWAGLIIGALIAGIFGFIIGYPCFKLKGPYFTLTTIAFAELLRTWFVNNETLPLIHLNTGGAMGLVLPRSGQGFLFMESSSKTTYYYFIFIILVAVLLVSAMIKSSRFGYYLTAIKSDPDAAASLGINVPRMKMYAMVISSVFMGIGGTFYAEYFRYIGPDRVFGLDLSIQFALIALIGGQGTVFGPVIGAFLLIPLSETLSASLGSTISGLHLFLYGVVMIFVVLFMPKGIYGPIQNLLTKIWNLILNAKDRKKVTKPGGTI